MSKHEGIKFYYSSQKKKNAIGGKSFPPPEMSEEL